VYLACFIDGNNSSIDRKHSYEVGEDKIIRFGGLRMREKQNGRSYTSNEHLHKIKGKPFLVTIFEHLDYSNPLPHSTACNISRESKNCVIGVN
jgi:hypothetical protein